MTRLSFSFASQGQLLRTLLAALCLGVYVLPAAGQSQRASSAADFIVAVVNSTPITNVELQLRLLRVQQQLSRQGKVPPRSQLLREVLERLILERAQLQLARELGVTPDDAAVDQAVDNVALQNQVSLEELKRRLSADGVDFARFRADVRDELTLVRLREREVDSRVKVSEQDIDQFFRDRQAQAGAEPERIQLAQILVAVPESATADQVRALQAKAQRALERVRAGEAFDGVAAEVSDAADRAAGGDLGLRPVDRLPSLFVDAVRDLKDGALAGPLRSGAGFHVLQLVKRSRDAAALTVIQTRARHILFKSGPKFNEAQATAKLLEFKRQIVAGQADFAALARDNSEDGSAKAGGDLGWASAGMFVPEFEQVMNRLRPGQVAEPLVSRFGVHLIDVTDRRDAPMSDAEQRMLARNILREKKLDEAYVAWAEDVRGRAYV